jgi:hypothetical protein
MSEAFIPTKMTVHVVGKVAKDAKVYKGPKGPICKFSVYIWGGKDKETGEKYPSKFLNVTLFGSEGEHVKKGDDVEFFARWSQSKGKDGKFYEDYVVNTNENKKPAFNHAGSTGPRQRHVGDEEVASGRGRAIQRKPFDESSLEITDEDLPF